jgi:thiosulfate dehydrogenase
MRIRFVLVGLGALIAVALSGCSAWTRLNAPFTNGGIVVKNVATDPLPADPRLAAAVRQGEQIFMNTPANAARYTGASLSCTSCHIGVGQAFRGFPVSGVAAVYPQWDPRSNSVIDLTARVINCFVRSMNGTAPPNEAPELQAVVAYLTWLSDGQPIGTPPPGAGSTSMPQLDQIPIDRLDPKAGETLFRERCSSCHGIDGQGSPPSAQVAAPPLWGDRSWNDGAGLGQVYTLAGFIRNKMPATMPQSLSWQQAQQLAAYIAGQPRPVYAGKSADYAGSQPPVDAVYYPQRYPTNPLSGRANR